ncbi:hypothetical protein Tco_1253182 [Tanacetum coccineum]
MIKFPTPRGIATLVTRTVIIAECRRLEKKQMIKKGASKKNLQEEEGPERVDLTEQTILLKKSMDVFAWEPADMTGVPKRIIKHSLNVNPSIEPVAQKGRVLASDRTQVVIKEVEEWVNAGIVRPIRITIPYEHPSGKLEVGSSVLITMFLDAFKGYHQVRMAQEDARETHCTYDRGTYCSRKMPSDLKMLGATLQRLVGHGLSIPDRKNPRGLRRQHGHQEQRRKNADSRHRRDV